MVICQHISVFGPKEVKELVNQKVDKGVAFSESEVYKIIDEARLTFIEIVQDPIYHGYNSFLVLGKK